MAQAVEVARLNAGTPGRYDAALQVGSGETCDGGATVVSREDADHPLRRAPHASSALRPIWTTVSVVSAPERDQGQDGGLLVVAFVPFAKNCKTHPGLGSP